MIPKATKSQFSDTDDDDIGFYTIGDLSREFDISLRTLRFYEDRGLIHPVRKGTTRCYSAVDRLRLQMILKGKKLGFTLTEIQEMIGKRSNDLEQKDLRLRPQQIVEQIEHLERQRQEIDVAISELRATHARLDKGARAA